MNIIHKSILLVIASTMLISSNLYAKENKPKQASISKAFFYACEKRSKENPYADYRAEIGKFGQSRCSIYAKYTKPHCPKGYSVIKEKCRKVTLIQ